MKKKDINKKVNAFTKNSILFIIWLVVTVVVWGIAAPFLVSYDDTFLVIAGYVILTIHILITSRIAIKAILKLLK